MGVYGVLPHALATHGRPTKRTRIRTGLHGRISGVHNGIIENYLDLKHELQKLGTNSSANGYGIIAH